MKTSIDIFGNPPAKTLAQKALFQLNMHIFCTNVGRTKESIDAMDKALTLLKQQADLEWAGECFDEDFEIDKGMEALLDKGIGVFNE
jgi:hypothetical protein